MSHIYKNVEELIGHTPLMRVSKWENNHQCHSKILVKLEMFNPAGSVKDRVAKTMLDDAVSKGLIDHDTTIIEPTSGNTGIGLAAVSAARGYRTIIVMPETMSLERQKLMKAYGAELILSEGSKGMQGAVDKASELASKIPNSFIPGQFVNPANAMAHFNTTGPEIWQDTDGNIDYFVAGIGTGGTITGIGQYLKSRNPNIKIIAVEPERSPLLSKGTAAPHGIQGIGANFIPSVLDKEVYDDIILVSDQDAYSAARELGKTEGLLVGISSGAALCAANKLAQSSENKGKIIVALLPDTGERYLSTPMFQD